jgi:hypothetical protein
METRFNLVLPMIIDYRLTLRRRIENASSADMEVVDETLDAVTPVLCSAAEKKKPQKGKEKRPVCGQEDAPASNASFSRFLFSSLVQVQKLEARSSKEQYITLCIRPLNSLNPAEPIFTQHP